MRNTLIAFALLTAIGTGAASASASALTNPAPGHLLSSAPTPSAPVQTVQWYGDGGDWRWRRYEAWREHEAWRRHEYWAHRRWECRAYGRCW